MNGEAQTAKRASRVLSFDIPATDPTAGSHRRLIGLDVLRFFAAMLVLHVHAVHQFGRFNGDPSPDWLKWIIQAIAIPGPNGVDIFFVLSGFLVAGLFFEELKRSGTVSPGRFLIRRAFKIYPQFWAMTAATVCCYLWQSYPINLSALVSDLLFLQSYIPGLWLHTWTLSVEEHFYALLAVCFLILKKTRGRKPEIHVDLIPAICLAVIFLCLGARIATWRLSWEPGFTISNDKLFTQATHVRIDALFFGVLLAFFWHRRWSQPIKARIFANRWLLLVIGAFLLLTPYPMRATQYESWLIFGYMLLYLGSGCLLLAALSLDHARCPKFFCWLAWLGRYSYAVYLWHMMVLWALLPITGTNCTTSLEFLGKELLFLVIIWLLGIALTKLIEFPSLRFRDRFFPSRA